MKKQSDKILAAWRRQQVLVNGREIRLPVGLKTQIARLAIKLRNFAKQITADPYSGCGLLPGGGNHAISSKANGLAAIAARLEKKTRAKKASKSQHQLSRSHKLLCELATDRVAPENAADRIAEHADWIFDHLARYRV
jgi:hypothetical protein